MAKYRVMVQNTVSSAVEVEADGPEAAIEAAFQSNDMPGSITIQAFGDVSVDDGEWEPYIVMDESGAEVWKDDAK